jgi:hypothetical protein
VTEPETAPATAPSTEPVISPDGRWSWDGQAWQPVAAAPTHGFTAPFTPPATTAPIAALPASPQYSPDGRYYWTGVAWVPVTAPASGYGSAMYPYGSPDQHASRASTTNGFTAGACVCGAVALLFFPILFGPVGIILGAIAASRKERRAAIGLAVAAIGTLIGFILGILAYSG